MHWALARTGHLLRALQRKYVTPSITADAHPTLLQNDAQRRVNRTRRYSLRTLVVTAIGLTITFRPLCEADLPMLHDWIHRPHVAQWWGGGDAGVNLENPTKKYLPRSQTASSIKPIQIPRTRKRFVATKRLVSMQSVTSLRQTVRRCSWSSTGTQMRSPKEQTNARSAECALAVYCLCDLRTLPV